MSINKYFNFYQRGSEQNLMEDLLIESIKIFGVDAYYLPRHLQKEDLLFGEDVVSKFDDYFEIEIYIKNVDGFEGQGDLFKKFGIEVQDQATILVSRTRFAQEVHEDIEPQRPREGDLLFFPLNGALMEIKFVSNEKFAFYQLGEWHVYQMDIQQFAYSHEDLNTGIDEIDQDQKEFTYQFKLGLGAGSGIFTEDEQVYQGASLVAATAKAIVLEHNNPVGTLRIRNLVGEFVTGTQIHGATGGASYNVTLVPDQDILNDGSANNQTIENEGDNTIDFSEHNPFSEDDNF